MCEIHHRKLAHSKNGILKTILLVCFARISIESLDFDFFLLFFVICVWIIRWVRFISHINLLKSFYMRVKVIHKFNGIRPNMAVTKKKRKQKQKYCVSDIRLMNVFIHLLSTKCCWSLVGIDFVYLFNTYETRKYNNLEKKYSRKYLSEFFRKSVTKNTYLNVIIINRCISFLIIIIIIINSHKHMIKYS